MEEIIVTARRVEERLQDVPISITVFSQEQLTKNNIVSAKDIAAYTPGFWSVSNPLTDAGSIIKQSQIINTTTWKALDDLTIKNIVSYGEYRSDLNLGLFGAYTPNVTPGTETSGNDVKGFSNTHTLPGHHTNAESSLVEELQFQGRLLDAGPVWQGGFYFESSKPFGLSGVESNTFTPCEDINTFNCIPLAGAGAISLGRISYSTTRTSFQGKAVYFQTSYDLTSKLKLTGGIRYTEDRMKSTDRYHSRVRK